ncbi:gamma-aminobutyrate permease, partial [Methylobacterium radiotolerans]
MNAVVLTSVLSAGNFPYTDPHLLRNDVEDISVSPFALDFERAACWARVVMNAVVLTSVLSAGN